MHHNVLHSPAKRRLLVGSWGERRRRGLRVHDFGTGGEESARGGQLERGKKVYGEAATPLAEKRMLEYLYRGEKRDPHNTLKNNLWYVRHRSRATTESSKPTEVVERRKP